MSNTRKNFLKISMLLGATALLGMTPAMADVIKIGLLGGQTGGLASLDQPLLLGAQLAVEEMNAKGGVNGNTFEIIPRDTRSDTG